MIFDGAAVVYLLIGIFCLICMFVRKNYHATGSLPPGPRPLPLIGNLHQIKTSQMTASLKKLSEKYGPVYTLHLGLRQVVILWGYDAVKEALVRQGEEFSGRGSTPTFETVFENSDVFTSSGSRWKELRRFTILTLRKFGMRKRSIEELIQEEAQHLIEVLRNTKESPFDPALHLSSAISNIICSIVFGNRFNYEDKEFLELLEMINDVMVLTSSSCGQIYSMFTDIMYYLPGPHTKIHQKLCCLQKFVERSVQTHEATVDDSDPHDFIDSFLIKMKKEEQNPATEYSMKTLVITSLGLLIAGTETVSTTIRHGLLILLKYPAIEEKIHAEIDCVIGRNRIPSIEDRIKMPYTEAVLNEIQRFASVLPLGAPHRLMKDTKFRGFMLPKGTDVYPVLTSVLRDPTQFADPENFNPSNFLDNNGSLKKNDAFLPFSAGKRICLGERMATMELFIYLTAMLQNFKLKFLGDLKEIDLTPQFDGFMSYPMQYEIQLIPR